MLNWLSSASNSKGKTTAAQSLFGSNDDKNNNNNNNHLRGDCSIIYVEDKNPEIIAEPIFDEDPALYILFPHANNPGSQAPKVSN